MKRLFFLVVAHFLPLLLITFVLQNNVQAQNNNLFGYQNRLQLKQKPAKIKNNVHIRLDSTLITTNPYTIGPNGLKFRKNHPKTSYTWPSQLDSLKTSTHLYKMLSGDQLRFSNPDANSGSKDPGIFYAPNEQAEPAGIVIKPLKNLDPLMVINPDKKQKD